jgi:hypothetical protein
MHLDLTDDEADALAKHLRQALDEARYPLAPRLKPDMAPTCGQGRRRR